MRGDEGSKTSRLQLDSRSHRAARKKGAGRVHEGPSDLDACSCNALAVPNHGSAYYAWKGGLREAVARKATLHILRQDSSSHRAYCTLIDNIAAKVARFNYAPFTPCVSKFPLLNLVGVEQLHHLLSCICFVLHS